MQRCGTEAPVYGRVALQGKQVRETKVMMSIMGCSMTSDSLSWSMMCHASAPAAVAAWQAICWLLHAVLLLRVSVGVSLRPGQWLASLSSSITGT
jgi:hypothetical protein